MKPKRLSRTGRHRTVRVLRDPLPDAELSPLLGCVYQFLRIRYDFSIADLALRAGGGRVPGTFQNTFAAPLLLGGTSQNTFAAPSRQRPRLRNG
jgi:hypothetical protein